MFLLLSQVFSTLDVYVGTIIPPIAVALGGMGNVFCLLVFVLSPLRKLHSSPVLTGLSVCHLVALTCILLAWMQRVEVYVVTQPGWCRVLNYFHHVSNFLAVAFVLCFSVERFRSLSAHKDITTRIRGYGARAYRKYAILTVVLVVVVGALYSFLFAMMGRKKENCGFLPIPGYKLSTVRIPRFALYTLHMVMGLMALATLGIDLAILFHLCRHRCCRRRNNNRGNNGTSGSADEPGSSRSLRRDFDLSVDNVSIGRADDLTATNGGYDTSGARSKASTLPRPLRVLRSRELRRSRSLLSIRSTINATKMLLAASLTLTLMQLPFSGYHFYVAACAFAKIPADTPSEFYNMAASLYILSLSVDFIVFMIAGPNFREAVKMLITCQYGRACAHSACFKRRHPAAADIDVVVVEPEVHETRPVRSAPGGDDSVSRYIDDVSRASVPVR